MVNPLKPYSRLEKHILRFVAAAFFMQLVNSAFFMILNIYMSKHGFADHEIAKYLSFRYLTVMVMAIPMGLLFRKTRLLPFFAAAGILLPAAAFGIVQSIESSNNSLLQLMIILWGIGFFLQQSISLPYILRNCGTGMHSEAIALSFSTWSVSLILTGIINFSLTNLFPNIVDERFLLTGFSIIGLLNLFFITRIFSFDKKPTTLSPIRITDGLLIGRALMPTLIIAIGAGLTIQFINLFFFHVFGIDYDWFSLMGASTAVLVSGTVLMVPRIKRRFGYRISITLSQSLAVLVLIMLATTEYFSYLPWVAGLAVGLYILRQPLMSMANPLTSELVMYYVGPENREITSALTSAIWSGSWFFSSMMFGILRQHHVDYSSIFYLTAALYTVGVVLFYLLIRDYEKRREQMA